MANWLLYWYFIKTHATNVRKYDSTMTFTHNSSTLQHYNVKRHQFTNECLKTLKLQGSVLALSVTVFFFLFCLRINISGTAERICAKIHVEDVFGPSLGRVWKSRSKVKGQGHQGQKTRCACTLINDVPQQRTAPFRRCQGWFRWLACGLRLVKHF